MKNLLFIRVLLKKPSLLFLFALMAMGISYQQGFTQENNFSIYTLNEKPYGITNEEWSVKWWKWLQEIPSPQNPAADKTGQNCHIGQNNTNVWFITGVLAGEADRQCTIPSGKAIYFGHGVECSTAEFPQYKTYEDLLVCAKDGLKGLVDPDRFVAKINGISIFNLTKYEVISPPFEVNLPKNNIWGVEGGKTLEAADTYFLFLKPLQPGNYVLEISTASPPPQPTVPSQEHAYNVKYNITIK